MPPTRATSTQQGESLIRDRGDACPGALRLHRADDGSLARLRLPGGLLTSRQVEALATAAERLADGHLSVTSRGNVELRGLGDACGGELATLLADAGLLPSEQHERVRNVVASPLAGIDGLGHADVRLWARELDGLLCAQEWTPELSGRFLFALDDGRGDVAGLGADVTLIAESTGTALLLLGDAAHRVPASAAPRAALAAAAAFLAAARAAGNGAWRVRELPGGQGVGVAKALEEAGIPVTPAERAARDGSPRLVGPAAAASAAAPASAASAVTPAAAAAGPLGLADPAQGGPAAGLAPAASASAAAPASAAQAVAPALGAPTGPPAEGAAGAPDGPAASDASAVGARGGPAASGLSGAGPASGVLGSAAATPSGPPPPGARHGAVLVQAPLGRVSVAQLRALLPAPGGEVRVTPWRGFVVPGFTDEAARERLRVLADAGFVTEPGSPWLGVGACTGRPGCAKSLADVRADAVPGNGGLPVHWSGCERRCGHPHGDWVDVLATGDGRYEVTVRTGGSAVPVTGPTVADAVTTARATRRTTIPITTTTPTTTTR
ncbi:cobalamin biosynthesis protein CobG [Streptomyces formicae]|nr:cobalamin biosynthesis protein CobG [Streptomyces formicae]